MTIRTSYQKPQMPEDSEIQHFLKCQTGKNVSPDFSIQQKCPPRIKAK